MPDGISLIVAIRTHRPGETIELTIVRDGEEQTVRRPARREGRLTATRSRGQVASESYGGTSPARSGRAAHGAFRLVLVLVPAPR